MKKTYLILCKYYNKIKGNHMTQRELLALESGLDDGALYSNFDERELTWRDGLVMIMLQPIYSDRLPE